MNLSFNHGELQVSVVKCHWLPEDCKDCSDYLLEAWERMTTSGIINEDGPGIYTVLDCDTTVEKTRLPRAAR